MKKILCLILIAIFLAGCGDTKLIDGITYDTYGFIDQDDKKNPDIKYELIIGNVVWSVLLAGTIVAPLYFAGFSIYEPIGILDKEMPKGSVY